MNTLERIAPESVLALWRSLQASPLGYRLARGAFWSVAGALTSRVLALAASIIVARFLGRVVFGEFGIVQSTVQMFSTFAGFGLGLTATKYIAQYRTSDPARAGRILGLSELFAWFSGLLVAVGLYVFSDWLATHTLAAPQLGPYLRIAAALLVLGALSGAQTGALAGFEAFRSIAVVNGWSGLAAFPLTVAGVWWGGMAGALWGLVIAQAINWVLNFLALKREANKAGIPYQFKGCWQERAVLWRFSLPALLAGALVAPANWVCNALLVNQPNGYAEMGLFNAANQWRMSVLFLPGLLAAIVLPVLASLEGQKDVERQKRVLFYNIAFNGGFTFVVALAIAALAPWIMAGYGREFASGSMVLVLLVFSAVLSATIGVIGQSITSAGKMWWGMALNLVWALALIVCAWLSLKWGALGLAVANLAAYGIHLLTVSLYSYRYLLRHRSP